MSTYLSIDLDYWNENRDYKNLRNILSFAKNSCPNIRIVDSHEEIIDHVNNSRCTNIINLDYHSDISDFDDNNSTYLNCGTWANYISFRFKGTYTWLHPHISERTIDEGYCHVNFNPFEVPRVSGWNEVIKECTLSPEKYIDWGDIRAVGIAFSYEWLRNFEHDQIVNEAKKVLRKVPKVNCEALIY